MNDLLLFCIKAQVWLLIAGMAYLLFRRETQFAFRRGYLLFVLIGAIVFPLLPLPALLSSDASIKLANTLPVYLLPEIVVNAEGVIKEEQEIVSSGAVSPAYIVYICVSGIMLLFMAFRLFRLGKFIYQERGAFVSNGKYRIAEISGSMPTFSFFDFIYINPADYENPQDREQIVMHEKAHANHLHSIDILLAEFVLALYWVNPLCYYFKNELRAIHEYQADRKVISTTPVMLYSRLIAKEVISGLSLQYTHTFYNSLTLKRLKMLKKPMQKIRKWKFAFLIPGIAMALFVLACQDQIMDDLKAASESSANVMEYPPEVLIMIADLKKEHPDKEFIYIEGTGVDLEKAISHNRSSQLIFRKYENPETGQSGLVMNKSDQLLTMSDHISDETFTIVEQQPEPVGGMKSLYDHVGHNIQYPAEARKNGIEGKVFVQFVVNKEGGIQDVEVVRGIGGGCDEEAVRVISASPNWIPGYQRGQAVNVRMILPITFALGSKVSDQERPTTRNSKMNVTSQVQNIDGETYLTGNVTNEQGEPIARANVVKQGTHEGTFTDERGYFSIKLKETGEKIAISHVLHEMVVVGYN
ncbi:MAG: TonB family protein [Cyclobacteriaceae bacterium]|nr:TonB family protein [Cyclobacteriaceae bacterium]